MKKKGKKLISIALTVAMIAGLTACGKGNGGNGNGGSSAADASLAKLYHCTYNVGTKDKAVFIRGISAKR